jgi:hypothetical protein
MTSVPAGYSLSRILSRMMFMDYIERWDTME